MRRQPDLLSSRNEFHLNFLVRFGIEINNNYNNYYHSNLAPLRLCKVHVLKSMTQGKHATLLLPL